MKDGLKAVWYDLDLVVRIWKKIMKEGCPRTKVADGKRRLNLLAPRTLCKATLRIIAYSIR